MSKHEHHLLGDLTWVDAKQYFSENNVVILPVGSIEQHGPHNPLATDFQNAYAIAQEAAKKSGVLCLPGIPVGFSREHKEFPGTLWVSHQTFELYVKEVILSAVHHGAKKVIVVNGHGMNRHSLTNIKQELRETEQAYVTIWSGGRSKPDIPGVKWEVEGHGGVVETSLNLLVKEDTVHMERAVDEMEARYVHNFGDIKGWGAGVFPEVTADWAEHGSYGSATLATKEIGEKIFENRVKSLVEHVEYMKTFKVEPIKPYK